MSEHLEGLIKRALKRGRIVDRPPGECLSEEDISCLLEQKLGPGTESKREHILSCTACRETLKDCMSIMEDASGEKGVAVPELVTERAKALVNEEVGPNILDVVIAVGKAALELVRATGEVLIGGSLVPIPVLRSRGQSQMSQVVRVIKNLSTITADVEVGKSQSSRVDLTIRITDKKTGSKAEGVRASLLRDDRELESMLTESGRVAFEELRPANYKVLRALSAETHAIVPKALSQKNQVDEDANSRSLQRRRGPEVEHHSEGGGGGGYVTTLRGSGDLPSGN